MSASQPPKAVGFFIPRPMAKFRIFGFPPSGSRASVFRNMMKDLPEDIELGAVEYPGRGFRIKEEAVADTVVLAEILVPSLAPLLSEKPYIFWGPSIGSQVAFECIRIMRRKKIGPLPVGIVINSRWAPSYDFHSISFYANMEIPPSDDQKLLDLLVYYGGISKPFLENPTYKALVPGILKDFKNDLIMAQCYEFKDDPENKLDLPVAAFGGTEDQSTPLEGLQSWKSHAKEGEYYEKMYKGKHMFFLENDEVYKKYLAEMVQVARGWFQKDQKL